MESVVERVDESSVVAVGDVDVDFVCSTHSQPFVEQLESVAALQSASF
jgi:hypothetical protein